MKRILYLFLVSLSIIACSGGSNSGSSDDDIDAVVQCRKHNGKQLYVGPRGGCYYINSNNNKEYVDRAECQC